ncbi:MAG: hypothetical protein IJQ39_13425 [Thermoguttaceae bacterium]|nr:hypothetical protein [Thermoguttaceae bacterium]
MERPTGAKPHGRVDEVLPPKMLVLALPASKQEPTLSGGITQFAEGEPKSYCLLSTAYSLFTLPRLSIS